jgi:hypothetical protein
MGRSKNINAKDKMSRKEKQEMRKENEKLQGQLKTIVLPTLGVIAGVIIVYVLLKTRSFPNIAEEYNDEGSY